MQRKVRLGNKYITVLAVGLVLLAVSMATASLAAAANPQGVTGQVTNVSAPIEVTVGFTDRRQIADIVKAFWSDPEAARVRFAAFRNAWPPMATATLARVTYSDELVLQFPCDLQCSAHRADATRKLVQALSALPGIAYAEPDRLVQPQAPRS